MCFQRKTAGFTIFELVIVIVIIGILATYAIPTYQRIVARQRLLAAGRFVAAELSNARTMALTKKHRIQVVSTANDTLKFYSDEDKNGAFAPNEIIPNRSRVIRKEYVGISFVQPPVTTIFTTKGTATAPTTITLTNARNQTLRITVSILGMVTQLPIGQ